MERANRKSNKRYSILYVHTAYECLWGIYNSVTTVELMRKQIYVYSQDSSLLPPPNVHSFSLSFNDFVTIHRIVSIRIGICSNSKYKSLRDRLELPWMNVSECRPSRTLVFASVLPTTHAAPVTHLSLDLVRIARHIRIVCCLCGSLP